MNIRVVLAMVLGVLVRQGETPCMAAEAPTDLVPWPRSLQLAGGSMKLTEASRIVFSDATLAPLARVLGERYWNKDPEELKIEQSKNTPEQNAEESTP